MERCILHCDMNNFYASVECMLDKSLANRPIAVCGDVEKRQGIVLAKNYKAKAFGVETGEAVWQAKQKCRDLVIVPPHFEKYREISDAARAIYFDYTDAVEPFGLDECWLDVTGSLKLFGSGKEIADSIRKRIKNTLGVTVSIGVSFNKVFAKLGSDMKKPDAVTVIGEHDFREKIWGLPAKDLFGVGKNTEVALKRMGIFTIGDIAQTPCEILSSRLGKCGRQLYDSANGLDASEVVCRDIDMIDKSVGHGTTTVRDLVTDSEVEICILDLCDSIGHKLYKCRKKATGVEISVKDNRLNCFSRQKRFSVPTNSPTYIAAEAYKLFLKHYRWDRGVRAVTVRAIDLVENDAPYQIDMFSDAERISKLESVDGTVERLREEFGDDVLRRAVMIHPF